jgi:hypothetical protein
MVNGADVMEMLIPTGGWIMVGNDYEGITFLDCEPITKAEFEAGFAQYDAWKAEQDAAQVTTKNAAITKLAALGLDLDDLKSLGL